MYYFSNVPESDATTALAEGFESWFEVEGDIDDFIFYGSDETKNCSER